MGGLIHPSAEIDPSAELHETVRVGAFAVIGPNVELDEGCHVGAGAQLRGPMRLGKENRIFPHACVGFDPQDQKYQGEESFLEIGSGNILREFTSFHRGTSFGGGSTSIGDDNLFQAYCHVGHDSKIGSRCVFVNGVNLAGHVEVGDDATISAVTSVAPFCRVGRHAYIGGYSVITMDALPFSKTVGQKPAWYGINRIGMQRKGYGRDQLEKLESAFRILLRSGLNTSQALAELRSFECLSSEVDHLMTFVAGSEKGIIKAARRGKRGV